MAVAAGVVGDARQAAVVARLDVTAERGGAAGGDRAHHAPLDAPQMAGVRQTIGVAMPTQNIGHLEAGAGPVSAPAMPHRCGQPGGNDLQGQTIERAPRRPDRVGCDLRVARGRRQIVVPEQDLNDPDVGPVLQKMRREAVAQRVQRDALGQPRRLRPPTGRPHADTVGSIG